MTDDSTTEPPAESPKPKRAVSQASRVRARKPRDPVSKRFVSKLTPEVLERLEKALASGAPPEDASPFAGISRRTYQEWMREARTPGCDQIYLDFIEMVEDAISRWGVGLYAAVTKAAQAGDTKAALELLRSRGLMPWPQSRREIGNVEGEPFRMMVASFDVGALPGMSDEELSVLRRAAEIMAAHEGQPSNVIDMKPRREALGP